MDPIMDRHFILQLEFISQYHAKKIAVTGTGPVAASCLGDRKYQTYRVVTAVMKGL